MNLLSLDPGGLTGWSIWTLGDDKPLKLIECGQTPGGVGGFIDGWRGMLPTFDLVVSESFRLDGRTPKPDVTPLKIEGALLALRDGQPVTFQANTYKSHAPDDLLKRHGLYKKGQPHAVDAIRHAVAWAKTRGHRPTIELLWPAVV